MAAPARPPDQAAPAGGPGPVSLPAVILTAIGVQAAQGVFDVCLPLRAEAAGLSASAFGWAGAAHALGFLAGASIAPRLLARLGGYGALLVACALATPLLILVWVSPLALWVAVRLGAGAAFALLFAATDTAVLDAASAAFRSRAIGLYVMCERLAMVAMPFVFAGRLAAPVTLVGGVACLWLSLLPGRTMRRAANATTARSGRLGQAVRDAWRLSPVAVLGAVAAGALNTSALLLMPRWAHGLLGEEAVPFVQAAAWCGALCVQLAVGFLAPPALRLRLGAWLWPVGGLAMAAIPWAAHAGLLAGLALVALWGMAALAQYGLALMALAEAAAARDESPPTPAMVFLWGAGAVVGPAACAALGLFDSPERLFASLGAVWLLAPLAALAPRIRSARPRPI